MEIKVLKRQLRITSVLGHYGLKHDPYGRLHCPFHRDRTPSLQVFTRTDTFCCFSTNCSAGTGDAIDFIQRMEGCSKHEAILKAKSLLNAPAIAVPTAAPIVSTTPADPVVLAAFFAYCKKALPLSKKGVAYLNSRSLGYKQHEVGYNSGGVHGESKNHHLVADMVAVGLLKPRAAGGYSVWAKDCILFPLHNTTGEIVSLYGRSITNDTDNRHFYLSGRSGLYPGYPAANTRRLLLTESIIDAASLVQQEVVKEAYTVLALYGTHGLTEEHQQAILGLRELEEIIFLLDGDEAGDKAVAKHYGTLRTLLPDVNYSKVTLPEGEDVNSVLQAHADASVLIDLIKERVVVQPQEDFFLSPENENLAESLAVSAVPVAAKLTTTQAELLVYTDEALRIEVLGGIKIAGLDRMKVTLKLTHRQRSGLPLWHSLDLYHHGQREQLLTLLADHYELSLPAVGIIIAGLTTELEGYRLQRIEALQPKKETGVLLTAAQKEQAMTELKKPDLLVRTQQLLAASGIVGESTNALIAYLVYCTRKQAIPLHVMFLGASGSGKTHLQESISELIPEEDKIEITQITENALYYFKQDELKHKLLLIEDLDGAEAVFYPLRELQTKRRISKTVTLKDNKGNLKTISLTVEGPVCVSGCTTKEKIYEDNANRCLLLYIDQSKEQDKRITAYQTKAAAGAVNREKEQQYRNLFKNLQRVLKPVRVINPYAEHLALPEQVFKPRRTMTLLLGFIEAVTFYHQYQREVKRDPDGQFYIETTPADIAAAFGLLTEVLFSKSDELTNASRRFFEQLKTYLSEQGLERFSTSEIRRAFRMEPRTIQRYLRELSQYGYVRRVNSGKGRVGFDYRIIEAEEYSRLRSAIDAHVGALLQTIGALPATMRQ